MDTKDILDKLFGESPSSAQARKEVDLTLAFYTWAAKQKFWTRLPAKDSDKIQIVKEQLLSLMREAYKAGYNRHSI